MNANPAPAVILVMLVLFQGTAINHRAPAYIGRRHEPVLPVAMGGAGFIYLRDQAATAFGAAAQKIPGPDVEAIAARAFAFPHHAPAPVGGAVDDGQLAENTAQKIGFNHRIFPYPRNP